MFISSNFCITFGFTNSTKTISKNNIFSMKLGSYIYSFPTYYLLLLVNLWNFSKKCFDLISLSLQQGILMYMKAFIISNKLKFSPPHSLPFWNSLTTLIMKHNRSSTSINLSFIREISSSKFDDSLSNDDDHH